MAIARVLVRGRWRLALWVKQFAPWGFGTEEEGIEEIVICAGQFRMFTKELNEKIGD